MVVLLLPERFTMPYKKPVPFLTRENKPRRLCPVCRAATYSIGGIHPQCAKARAERLKAVKTTEESRDKVVNPKALSPWHKLCPKCHTQLHARKPTCRCGHRFSIPNLPTLAVVTGNQRFHTN